MNEYYHSKFFRRYIDGAGDVFDGFRFEHCQFYNCVFSRTDIPVFRSAARNVQLIDCEISNCSIGPAILEDVVIDGLKTHGLPICWGTLFKNVVLRGELGNIKVNKWIDPTPDPSCQRAFDEDRDNFYHQIDWAIDISEARFKDEFDMRGVPSRLVRFDAKTQGVVTRESALKEGWRERVRSRNDYWVYGIDLFLQEGDDDVVFAAPKAAPTQKFRDLLDSLNELKELGVVLNHI
jgi:hypothetical protein